VAGPAHLQVEHLVVEGDATSVVGLPLTDVAGSLLLRASLFDGINGHSQPSQPASLLPLNRITASGQVRLENVSLRRLFTPCIQIGRGCQRTYPVWSVAGELIIDSSTLGDLRSFGLPGIAATAQGRVVLRNSLELSPAITCSPSVVSEGGNLWQRRNPGEGCTGPDDVVAAGTGAPVDLPPAELRGGLVPTLQPFASDTAAIGRNCLPTDARGALRPRQSCTPGALELQAQTGDDRLLGGLGGAGVWYDPDNDGHFLQIQPLPEDQLLVTWLHFDAAGEPAWAYLVATPDAGRLAGEALRNRSVAASEGLPAAEAIPWGQLEIRFEGCDRLMLSYASGEGGPGNGSILLRRLTELPGVGCR
jgi:hypothetical protein